MQDCCAFLPQVLTPTETVRDAMSAVKAAQRQREAAWEQGEADKVRPAGEAFLRGRGVAAGAWVLVSAPPAPARPLILPASVQCHSTTDNCAPTHRPTHLQFRAVKHAEASSESKYLQGQGMARFLIAFAAGARDAMRVMVTGRWEGRGPAWPCMAGRGGTALRLRPPPARQ